jgi:hypothetical protein
VYPTPPQPISFSPFLVPQSAKTAFLEQTDVAVFELNPFDISEMVNFIDCLKQTDWMNKAAMLLPKQLMDRIRRCPFIFMNLL